MIVRSLAYGLAAHLLIGWAFFFFVSPLSREVERPLIPVQIHIAEKPRVPVKKATELSEPGSGGHKASPSTRGASVAPPALPSAQTNYSELLPQALKGEISLPEPQESGDPSLLPGQRFKAGSTGATKQKLMVDASILSGALDVPLHARRISSGSEAFLRIKRLGKDRLTIVDLRGDPMLRAVIYENLHEPRIFSLILGLMEELQETSLPLTLRILTGAAGRLQDETDFTWIGRRLIIRKAAPPESKAPAGAIALPDEDAKKALIRDRLEFERFQRSAAYRSAIQNYELPLAP
jgi:hypothetical protein